MSEPRTIIGESFAALAEMRAKGWRLSRLGEQAAGWIAILRHDDGRMVCATASNAPAALCEAILKAEEQPAQWSAV